MKYNKIRFRNCSFKINLYFSFKDEKVILFEILSMCGHLYYSTDSRWTIVLFVQ